MPIVRSLLNITGLDMIEHVTVSDPLHLLHLGIDIRLPSEIHRAVRGLRFLSMWKGSECAAFLNYIGIVLFKDFLPEDEYFNFIILFCASKICYSDTYYHYLDMAHILFEQFIENCYHYVTSNIHNLYHVDVDEIKRFGNLSTISTYPFENALFQI